MYTSNDVVVERAQEVVSHLYWASGKPMDRERLEEEYGLIFGRTLDNLRGACEALSREEKDPWWWKKKD